MSASKIRCRLAGPYLMRIRSVIGTLCGIAAGLLACVIWMLTFQPHGGIELSRFLFPLSAFVLKRMCPMQSIPVTLWYGVALLQWVAFGATLDLLRIAFRRRARPENTT